MILVTGGTGFVGAAVADALTRHRYHVAVMSRRRDGRRDGAQMEVRQADVLDPSSLAPAMAGVTTVIHLASALPGEHSDDAICRTNVEGTANVARAARAARVRQFIHASSAGVYGDGATPAPRTEACPVHPVTLYERTKFEAEEAVAATLAGSTVSWLVLRPSGVHGPGRAASAAFLRQVVHRRLWLHGPATVLVHPTYVADVVAAVLKAVGRIDQHGETFNVAGPRVLTYPGLIDLVASRLGVRVRHVQVPPVPLPVAAAVRTMAGRLGLPLNPVPRVLRVTVNRTVDTTKAQRVLGFVPAPLEEGLDATIAWARGEHLL